MNSDYLIMITSLDISGQWRGEIAERKEEGRFIIITESGENNDVILKEGPR